jgi:hypothetical protein
MKNLINAILSLVILTAFSVGNLFGQSPKLTIKATKRILTLDDEKPNLNITKMDMTYIPGGTKKVGVQWVISGEKDKDWVIKTGDLNSESIEVQFRRVGNYNVSAVVTYSYKKKLKNGEVEEEEEDLEVEEENFIAVTNNLDELTQLHADSNFVKLVKRSSDYAAKPKYANDPTPTIFLAKGYYGMYRKGLKDPQIQEPYDEAVNATATAIEMDQTGIFYTPVHKMWLNGFQQEILQNGITFNLENEEGYPSFYMGKDPAKRAQIMEGLMEGMEQYTSITKNPVATKMLEAAIRYQAKDFKNANLIYKNEIKNVLALEKLDKFTEADKAALKMGVILSAQVLPLIEKNNTNACALMSKIAPWFENDKDFIEIFEKKFNSCKPE